MNIGSDEHYWHCKLDTSGRIVIPQAIRNQKHLSNGDELIVGIEEGTIVMRTYEDAMQKLQDAFCEGLDPNLSLVEELYADRLMEAELEARS